jgi:dihydroorotate dehydrogenase
MRHGWLERKAFSWGVLHPRFFRWVVRREAYRRAKGDPEKVHELALEAIRNFDDILAELSPQFEFPRLRVDLKGQNVFPFGIAAGLDKNADALLPLSRIFGFLEPGTVVVKPREGNPRPRLYADVAHDDVYNAQGFPSRGLSYFLADLRRYREAGGDKPVYVSICGIPPTPDQIEEAHAELEQLVKALDPYADGFVWNPFSPNTAALRALREPEEFRKSAELISRLAGANKLKLVKMGPCESTEATAWLNLANGWMEGGGDGVVAVNTYLTPRNRIPMEKWGYPTAGRSGRFLQRYRQRAIELTRKQIPNSIIIATGGIDSAEQAWAAFEAGADALEGYTPYTFSGFGLLLKIAKGLEARLNKEGFQNLQEFLQQRRSTSSKGQSQKNKLDYMWSSRSPHIV